VKSSVLAILLSALVTTAAAQASDTKTAEQAGAILYRNKGCGFCHGANLEGTKKAPALAEIRKQKPWTNEKISNQILDGGQKMPPFRESLSDEEISQLIAYLRAKNRPTPPAQPAAPSVPAAPATPQQ